MARLYASGFIVRVENLLPYLTLFFTWIISHHITYGFPSLYSPQNYVNYPSNQNFYQNFPNYQHQSWQSSRQKCANGICAKVPHRRQDPEQPGPVFVGGSFDFDLSQLSHLIGPMYEMLKNSEIIKVGTGSTKESNSNKAQSSISEDDDGDRRRVREKNRPLITLGMPEIQFIQPTAPIRAVRPALHPDMYHMADSHQTQMIHSMRPKRKKPKKRKKPNRSKPAPLISFVEDDEEDGRKNEQTDPEEEEEEEKGEDDDDKKDLEQLLELGLPGALLDEFFGNNRGLIRPGKILTHLTLGTIARAVMKRVFKSMFARMMPRFG
ncbi:uncharacterized protein LOC141856432 [Brevipalpus obovatus]|uniref:uncharacterized protein LOC141856432 n=1 Tax=Brevipalpus obovatus TaxID=246614 RepID=UPI003D9F9B72